MARGSIVIFVLVMIAVAAAIAWSVTQGIPGIVSPLGTHNPSDDPDFKIDRATGTAPLGITFFVKRDVGTIETINYGDGTSADISDFVCGLTYCLRLHTYTSPGTYHAAFESGGGDPVHGFVITATAP